MAKTAAKRPAKAAPAKTGGGMKPVFLAAGLGLYWFVEYQEAGGASDMPVWGYAMTVGVRLLADFVGAWVIVSASQLLLALGKLGIAYLRGLWLQGERRVSARLNLAGASVLPFEFPSLRNDEPPPPILAAPPPAEPVADAPPSPDPHQLAETIAAELAAAREEGLRRGLDEGREQGYAAGFAEGAKAGEAKMMEAVRQMAAIIGKLGMPVAALEQPVEEAVAALALEVARCVIGDEVQRSREFLVRLVREAIARVPLEMGAPRVLLNPGDLDLVRRLVPEIDDGHALLVPDETIEAGGALIVADGEERQIKDRRWNPRTADGVSEVNLTLSSRWRAVMLTLFDGEDE